MAGTTQVTFAELDAMSKKTADTNSAVQGELTRIRSLVDSTTADWQGSAQQAFGTLMTSWDSDTRKLNEALRQISETLHASAVKFQAGQDQHTSEINQVTASSLNL